MKKRKLILSLSGENTAQILRTMNEIAGYISEGATAFLVKEYQYMAVYIVAFSALLSFQVDLGTVVAFVVGAITSTLI